MRIKNNILLSIVVLFIILTLIFFVRGEDTLDVPENLEHSLEPSVMFVNDMNEEHQKLDSEVISSEATIFVEEKKDDGGGDKVIVETFDENETESEKSIDILTLNLPSSNMSVSQASFGFYINESNLDNFTCNFSLSNQTAGVYSAVFENSASINISRNLNNANYTWNILCFETSNSSINDFLQGAFMVNVDLNPKINFWLDKSNFSIGESVNIYVNASLLYLSQLLVEINYSDGRASSTENVPTTGFYTKTFSTQFANPGTYRLGLTVNVVNGGNSYFRNLSLQVYSNGNTSNNTNNPNTGQNGKDTQKPQIELISPVDDEESDAQSIEFVFSPKDDVKLANCTFNLFYYNGSNYVGTLVYKQFYNLPDNDEEISLTLREFDIGDYSWDIECIDNSSNIRVAERDFSVTGQGENESEVILLKAESNYENNVDEVEDLISKINEFLVEEEKYSLDNKEAVEFLGLLDDARHYKKRLLQLKSDLNDDLGYSRDSSNKEERLRDIRLEIEDIKKKVVYKVDVEKSESYSKNSLTSNLEEVLEIYFNSTDTFLSRREINRIADSVASLQNELDVENYIKWVNFEYLDGSQKQYSLVYKKLVGFEEFDGIIEVIPKSVSESVKEIQFIQENTIVLEDPMVFFKSSDIEGTIAYLIESKVDFGELKEIDSIAFSSDISKSSGRNSITGYSILLFPTERGFWFYFSWILFLLFLATIIYNSIRLSRVKKLKKDANFVKIRQSIKEAKNAIDDKNVPKAKEIYSELKVLYSGLSEEARNYFYNDLVKVQLLIDRKEISCLIRECINAINQKRIEDAGLIYSKIKPIYKRLPEDLRTRVYEKIIPFVK